MMLQSNHACDADLASSHTIFVLADLCRFEQLACFGLKELLWEGNTTRSNTLYKYSHCTNVLHG